MKNILVTGSEGFIGKNLIEYLSRDEDINIIKFAKTDSLLDLRNKILEIDFIFHLAGINRPKNNEEFYLGNTIFTQDLVDIIIESDKKIPILLSSSSQSVLDNDYGKSKLEAENILKKYAKSNDVPIYIYRLPGVFGKWSKPNYNSVISTWCYNIANNLDIKINDKDVSLDLVYIDDVVESFISNLNKNTSNCNSSVHTVYNKSLDYISKLLYSFKDSRDTLVIPNVGSDFERALYATYLSYLPSDKFSYELKGHTDERGTFYEILKTLDCGQFSISTTKPGDILRGNHYHNTKNEKFLVVKGEATIEFRHIVTNEIVSYNVSDKKMKIVEMIPGYTHNIKNTGDEEMVLFLWANETFDQNNPDTYFLEV